MDEPACPGCRALLQRIAALEARVAELTRLLEDATRAGKRQAAPFRKGPPKEQPRIPGRKAGDAHGAHGHRQPPPPEQIDEVHHAALPPACPDCGGRVEETHVACQHQVELPRRPVQRQFHIHVGQCRQCGRRVQGRHPLQTSAALGAAAAQLGPDLQAAIVVLNKRAGLAHGKISRTLRDLFGIRVTRGACAQVVLRAGRRCQPAYTAIEAATRSADWLVADETGWRIGGRPAWLHAWVGPEATCYAIDPKRSADRLQAVIGRDWDGVLIHDGFASYDRFQRALHQQCVAHLLRRADELLASARGGAVRFPRQVQALLRAGLADRARLTAAGAAPEAWEAVRWQRTVELAALLERPKTHPGNAALAGHLAAHLAEWFTFLEVPGLDATNWRAEQAIRPAVVNRKVWGGNRTTAGATAQAVLTSVLATCQQQARSALDYVSQTLRGWATALLPAQTLAMR